MPLKRTIEKARRDKREGKSASTQAGEFVHEEIDKIRHGEHGARSTKQAIAIGLSEARRAGVDLPPPKRGQITDRTRESAEYAYEAGQGRRKTKRRPRVSRAVTKRSNASRILRFRAKRCRGRRTAPPRAAPPHNAPRQPARPHAPRAPLAVPLPPKRPPGPKRGGSNGDLTSPQTPAR